jgi:FixJ family two-component response regulator
MIADSPVIHVLDDDPSMRRSLVRLLQASGWDARGHDSVSGFKATTAATDRGCLLLDVRLGDGSGLDLLEELTHDDSPLGIVVISGFGDVPSTVRAMRSGAVDVLTKPPDVARLQEAVARAYALSVQQFSRRLETERLRERYRRLTPREREVCTLVGRGMLNKQIAGELGTSEKTVKVHRGRVMAKLEVGSVAELVRLVDRVKAPTSGVDGRESLEPGRA